MWLNLIVLGSSNATTGSRASAQPLTRWRAGRWTTATGCLRTT